MNAKLLIVDDDLPFTTRLSTSMEKKGFSVESYGEFKKSLTRITEKNFDYAIVDMRLEDGSGLELIKHILLSFFKDAQIYIFLLIINKISKERV